MDLAPDKEYNYVHRLTARRIQVMTYGIDWKSTLALAPDEVVKKTLHATTKIVPTLEVET